MSQQRETPPADIPAGGRAKGARPAWALALFAILALAGVAGLTTLGVWQLERRVWKLDLIDRVDARIHAAPVPAPGPDGWPGISAAGEEYRRVTASGRFLNDRETLVQAVSDLGGGFWVLTPLVTDRGFTVLVNRGFVPPDRRDPASRAGGLPAGEVTVTGLLRMTEPRGGFLRSNDPAADRWYSRDVAAIAAARGLDRPAPYFIDADRTPNPGGWPAGGLTVVSFPNSHLSYALTWFALDLMLIGWIVYVVRTEWRRRR
ncbi:SURF1 family protein [Azospirillum picis]|uniref:SURF1-like protein n=1 Tax=Azospirillum picis TaxID=488438 RepID=A0ABU0MJD3_9PROT|nr:SURF1 family protein [Azospirillum picis]MBP2299781.1 surfeit locus 1 family protein [Azospirillum picis]MDQ0533577.1 surfeit locus 1 family protein [Azospirillum picis]